MSYVKIVSILGCQSGVQTMAQQDCTHPIPPRTHSALALLLALAWFAGRGLGQVGRSVVELALVWSERARQRRQLAELSDAMLRDIGLTRADASAEADKPFWRP